MPVGVTSRDIGHDRPAASVWRSPRHRAIDHRSLLYTLIGSASCAAPPANACRRVAGDASPSTTSEKGVSEHGILPHRSS